MVADSLEEGISDLFSELERERTTKRTLRKETRLLEAKFAEAQKSETEVVRLRRKLREADANYKSAVSSAEEALGRVQGQAAENKRLNLAVERHRRASEKKDAEIRELRATVEQKEKEVKRLLNRRKFLTRLLSLSCRVVFGNTSFMLWPSKLNVLLRIRMILSISLGDRWRYVLQLYYFSSRINHVTPDRNHQETN